MEDDWRESSRRRLIAGAGRVGRAQLLDHLIRAQQQRLRDRETEGLGCLEVDDEFKTGGPFDRKVARPGTAENLRNKRCRGAMHLTLAWAIRHQGAVLRKVSS